MDVEKIKTNFKRFFSNPNTFTFLLVILLIILVYLGYSYLINKAIQPTTVPYAMQEIHAKTMISQEMVGNVKISGTFVTASGQGLVRSSNQLIGKYIGEGYQVPEKSFFYKEMLADEKTAEKNVVADAPDGFTVFDLNVTFESTYGCSIMPGNYIDIYLKATDDDFVMFEKFIESIKVTRVVDKNGNDVFATLDETTGKKPKPEKIYFIVPTAYYELLRKALLINVTGLELIPVPRNAGYSENPKETGIASEAAEQFILNYSLPIGDAVD